MTSADFTPQMKAALDSYTVPPLPGDFAERALKRAQSTRVRAADAPGAQRRGSANPWRRVGRVATTIAAASALSATAAAMGLFGEDIRVPVVSEIVEKLELVPQRHAEVEIPKAPQVQANDPGLAASGTENLGAGIEQPRLNAWQNAVVTRRAYREVITERLDLPTDASRQTIQRAVRQERRERIRQNIQEMPPEERQAIAERVRGAAPGPERREVVREIIRERVAERRAEIASGEAEPDTVLPSREEVATRRAEIIESIQERRAEALQDSEPATTESDIAAPDAVATPESLEAVPDQPGSIDQTPIEGFDPRALTPAQRERLRNMTPAQRRQLRRQRLRELRDRRR